MVDISWIQIDAVVSSILWPLTVWILISGLDDLIVDVVALVVRLRGRTMKDRPSRRQLLAAPQKPIAILVPLWREAQVIAPMVQRNTTSLLYRNYHIFIGGYPNDEPTLREIRKLEANFPHVHLAPCPHDGPTSKADCLNWIFLNLRAYEEANGIRFEVIMTHDAEDVIHSDSLHWINHYSDCYDMVQVPVLPLATPIRLMVHGIYIDEFTEYQARDMPARQAMGAFVPSNGVGTGFHRDALDALACDNNNRVFEPVCLAEDYENGLRLRLRGARQLYLPLHREGMATRELFPVRWKQAIRQRTRWVTGIALQTWERHGWPGTPIQKYWLWRDRKGLIGNPASLLTNLIFVYWFVRCLCGASLPNMPLLQFGAFFGAYRILYRMFCVWQAFGPTLSLMTLPRVLLANAINTAATLCAFHQFLRAKIKGVPLVWLKTEHAYPAQTALTVRNVRLGELLVGNGYISQEQVDHALQTKPPDVRLGEHLVALGVLDVLDLYEALSLQKSVPMARVEPQLVKSAVARSLPVKVAVRHRLVPVKVELGRLFVVGPELPGPELRDELGRFTTLELEFQLVTPGNYDELLSALLPA